MAEDIEAIRRFSLPSPLRLRTAHIMFAVVITAAITARLAQQPGNAMDVPTWVVLSTCAAITCAALAFPSLPMPTYPLTAWQGASVRIVTIGALVLAVPSAIASLIWLQEPFARMHEYTHVASSYAAIIWLAGIVACLWYLTSRDRPSFRLAVPQRPWQLFAEVVLVLVILDIAAGLRVWRLGSLPEGIWFDEADFAASAQRLLALPFQPFGPGNVGHNPSLYFYAMAAVTKIAGDSIGAVRLTSAFFGTGAVLAVYLIARRVGGFAYAVIAAAMLATGKWAIDFSRFGMSNIAAPAMIGLAFVFLVFALQRPRALWFALTGLALGLSLLTYAGGFIAGSLVAILVVGFRLSWDQDYRQAAWPGALLLPLGLVIGGAPLLVSLYLDPDYTLARERTVSLFNEYSDWADRLSALTYNIRMHALMFTVQGDANGRHNLPGTPMLDPTTGTLFLLGLGMCLRHIRHWYSQLLLLWLFTSLLGGILSLSFEAPQGARTVGAVAPIALIAALPLAAILSWLRAMIARFTDAGTATSRRGLTARGLLTYSAALLALTGMLFNTALTNYDDYFVAHANDISSWSVMGGLQALVGRTATSLQAQGYAVRIPPELSGDPALAMAAGGQEFPAYDPEVPVPLPVPSGGLALIIPNAGADVLSFVKRSYPHARTTPLAPSFDATDVQAHVVIITPSDAAQNLGSDVTFGSGQTVIRRQHVLESVPWPPGAGPTTPAEIRATLVLGSAESWQSLAFRVIGLKQGLLTIDGAHWPVRAAGTGPLLLGAGNHSLSVAGRGIAGSVLAMQWAVGINPVSWTIIPADHLAAPTLPTGGMLGLYYPGAFIAGTPSLVRVDQLVNTYYQNPPRGLAFPFATRWLGTLHAPVSGVYSFALDSTGPSTLFIDGRAILHSSPSGGQTVASPNLTAGPHAIRVDYRAIGGYLHCYLTWTPPGTSGLVPIEPTFTEPDHG